MDADSEIRVTFFPNLYLQRRIWILNVLRRERVKSIVDIGCGQGELLAVLCQPALWLSDDSWTARESLNEDEDLHPRNIAGLDIAFEELSYAIENTSPANIESHERWEPLEVKIWKGSLEAVNPDFINVECIVSTEVVEHLSEDVLSEFMPVLLGVYHPRLLLVTTPSYDFNARFSPPGTIRPDGYPDPTHRTDRIFRHRDHKFEWTVEEFTQWCQHFASQWGYSVVIESIGRATEDDKWGRDEVLGGASQVAQFRRHDDVKSVELRFGQAASVTERAAGRAKHELMATHRYFAHPRSGMATSSDKTSDLIFAKMVDLEQGELRVEELWLCPEIGVSCGGVISEFLKVIENCPRLQVHKEEGKRRGDWRVELIGGVPLKAPTQLLPEDCEDTWSIGSIHSDTNSQIAVEWVEGQHTWDEDFNVDSGAGILRDDEPTWEISGNWVHPESQWPE